MSWSFCRGVPPSVVLASQVAPALKGRRHPLVDGIISSSISVTQFTWHNSNCQHVIMSGRERGVPRGCHVSPLLFFRRCPCASDTVAAKSRLQPALSSLVLGFGMHGDTDRRRASFTKHATLGEDLSTHALVCVSCARLFRQKPLLGSSKAVMLVISLVCRRSCGTLFTLPNFMGACLTNGQGLQPCLSLLRFSFLRCRNC